MTNITIKSTRRQVEVFLKHFDGMIKDWKQEKPKGKELQELKVLENFFLKIKSSQKKVGSDSKISEEPHYNTELVGKIWDEIRVLHVDLGNALIWRHLFPEVRDELCKKYNLKEELETK